MGTLFFIAKTFVLTMVVILLMQIQWNGSTVEQKTLQFIRTSNLTAPIQNLAESVTIVTGKWIDKTKTIFNTKLFDSDSRTDKKSSFFNLERSEEYKEYVVNKAKEGKEIIKNKANQGKEFSQRRMQKFFDEVSLNSKAADAANEETKQTADSTVNSSDTASEE